MKKIIQKIAAVTLAGAISCTLAISAFAVTGDISGDDRANSTDARIVLRYSAKLQELTDEQVKKADLNADDRVNSSDARALLRATAKLDSLEYYMNYYIETEADGQSSAIAVNGNDIYVRVNAGSGIIPELPGGMELGMIIKNGKSLIIIDYAKKQYGEFSEDDIKMMNSMFGETIDLKEIVKELELEALRLPTPAFLIELGYTKTAGSYNGKNATVYTFEEDGEKDTLYYDGMTYLGQEYTDANGNVGKSQIKKFSANPSPYMNSYINEKFEKTDPLVIMMGLA